jgi:hypothetical protein
MSRLLSCVLSRTWPLFVFLTLIMALSLAAAEDSSDVGNANTSPPEAAPAADAAQTQGLQPLGAQPGEQMRAPAEAPSPSEQEQQQAPAQSNPEQNANPNANQ